MVLTRLLEDENATEALARQLAAATQRAHAKEANWSMTVALSGDLGAGKTTLVRHWLRALGVAGRVKSPTYTVMEPYEVPDSKPPLRVSHFDFYRFTDPREWEDAGFRDVFAAPGLKLMEWPENAQGAVPEADVHLTLIHLGDTRRELQAKAHSPMGRHLLESVA